MGPWITTSVEDTDSKVTFEVLALERLTVQQAVQAIRMHLEAHPRKKWPKPGSTYSFTFHGDLWMLEGSP